MAISVVYEMTMVSAGNGTGNEVVVNDLGFTPQADDLILISVGGEGNNPNPNTWVADFGFQGGGTASATLIARDYGQDVGASGNSDRCQITVFGYVWQSGNTFDSLTINHNRKKLVGLAVLRGAEVTGFPSIDWVTNQSATSFLSSLDQTTVNDVPVSGTRSSLTTDDLPQTWNSTNFGTEAAVWMAFSHRHSSTFTPAYPDADGASWTGDTLTAINMASGYQIRPDSSPGTQYEVRWDRTGTSTSYFAVLAIGIPAATATGTNRDLAGTLSASGSAAGSLGITRQIQGSSTAAATPAGSLGRVSSLGGSLAASASPAGSLGIRKTLQGSGSASAAAAGTVSRICALSGAILPTGAFQGTSQVSRGFQGTSGASGAASGELSRTCAIEGTSAVTGSCQGSQGVSRAFQGDSQASSQAAGAISATALLSLEGSVSASAGLSGSQNATRGITAACSASASGAGLLAQTRPIGGDTACSGAFQGEIQGTRLLDGSAAGAVSLAGSLELAGRVELEGSVSASTGLSASPAVSLGLQGTSPGSLSSAGSLARICAVQGTCPGTGSAEGSQGVSRSIQGTFQGTVTAAGLLGAAASLEIQGTCQVQGTFQGTMRRSPGLQGSTSLVVSLAGAVSRSAGLDGSCSSAASAAGSLQATLLLGGSCPGSMTGSALISVTESEPLLKQGGRNLVQIQVLTEEITYYLGGDLTAGKTIRAVVERMEPDALQYSYEGGSLAIEVELHICTDSDLGIPVPQVGRDLADVVVTEGQPAERVRVVEVTAEDPGMMSLLAVR